MVQLAIPTFVSGPLDDLATADVYTQKSTDVINSIQRLVNNGSVDLNSVLRGGAAIASQLAGLLPVIQGVKDGVLSISKENLIARLALSSGTISSALRNMPSSLVSGISANLPAAQDVIAQVGSITQKIAGSNLSSLSNIGTTLAAVTGNTQLFSLNDRAAQVGVFSGLIQEAQRNGLQNTFGPLMQGITDPQVLVQVAQRTLPGIVRSGDVQSLLSAATQLNGGRVQMIYPQALTEFTASYARPAESTAQDFTQQWSDLKTAFGSVDSAWNSCTRAASGSILDITTVQTGSDDFQDLVSSQALNAATLPDKLLLLGSVFDPTTVDAELQRHFPYTLTGAKQRQQTFSIDPRALQATSVMA